MTVSFHITLKADYGKYSFTGLLIEFINWLNDRLKTPPFQNVLFCDYKVEMEGPLYGSSFYSLIVDAYKVVSNLVAIFQCDLSTETFSMN